MKTAILGVTLFVFLTNYSFANTSLLEDCPTHAQTLINAVQNYIYAKKEYDSLCGPAIGPENHNPDVCGSQGEKKKMLESAELNLKDAQYYVGATCDTCRYVESAFNDMYKEQIRILKDRIDVLEEIISATK